MSRPKPGQSGHELYGTNDKLNSRESNQLLARLYHPQTLDVIEQIANLPSTRENDRRRLLEIVERQRALIQEYEVELGKMNHQLPQTNFESYLRNLLSDEGALERDVIIDHVLQRDAIGNASTLPPPVDTQTALVKVTESIGDEVDLTMDDARRLEQLHDEIYGKNGESKDNAVNTRPRYLDIYEGEKYLVHTAKGESIFPGDVLTVLKVTFDKETLVRLENEDGKYFILDPDSLKYIAKKAHEFGNN